MLIVMVLITSYSTTAIGHEMHNHHLNGIAAPPTCINNKGEKVSFIDRATGNGTQATGMSARNSEGIPVVYRFNFATANVDQAFQRFVDRHECAHHQTGDVDRPHPARNSPEHLMNESIADCIAILRIRDEDGHTTSEFDKVIASLREEMDKAGFPEISISSRVNNIANCYRNDGSDTDFVEGVLRKRGLL